MAAERGGHKIAVEVQSFLNPSPVRDLEASIGQYQLYQALLAAEQPERTLYLAVPDRVLEGILSEPFGEFVIAKFRLRVAVFGVSSRRFIRWID